MSDIQYHFNEWVTGVFEDDPLPHEVNYLLFILDRKGKYYNLEFSGHERVDTLINYSGFYYPQEAQGFMCKEFLSLQLSPNSIFDYVKQLLFNYLNLPQAQFLSKIAIGLCFRYKNAHFLSQP